jgi:hypothetical protein
MPRIHSANVLPNQTQKDPKQRYSHYAITISSNVRPRDDLHAAEIEHVLKQKTEETFGTDEGLREVIVFNTAVPGHFYDDRYIQSVDLQYATEIGTDPRGGRVHIHIDVLIHHRSNITLGQSRPAIKARFMRGGALARLGVKNLYVKIQLVQNQAIAHAVYLEKQRSEAQRRSEMLAAAGLANLSESSSTSGATSSTTTATRKRGRPRKQK